jgi:putative peptide zinc metalloprotease protein
VVTVPGPISDGAADELAAVWADLQAFGEQIEGVPLAELRDRLTEFEARILDVVRPDLAETPDDAGGSTATSGAPDGGGSSGTSASPSGASATTSGGAAGTTAATTTSGETSAATTSDAPAAEPTTAAGAAEPTDAASPSG